MKCFIVCNEKDEIQHVWLSGGNEIPGNHEHPFVGNQFPENWYIAEVDDKDIPIRKGSGANEIFQNYQPKKNTICEHHKNPKLMKKCCLEFKIKKDEK